MPEVIGTNGNDRLNFDGSLQQLTLTITNPYSGKSILIDEEYNVNNSSYEGLAGIDILFMTDSGDAIFLDNHVTGVQMVFSVERFFAGDEGDIVHFASTVHTIGDVIVDGGEGADILWMNSGNDTVNGRGGNDIIDGGPGDDVLNGGAGNNIAGTGDDTISGGAGNDILRGEDGNDTLEFFADSVWGSSISVNAVSGATIDLAGHNRTHDTFDGGSGHDILVMTNGDDALLLNDTTSPRHPQTQGPRLVSIEEVHAGAGNDIVNLSAAAAYIVNGDDGNDILWTGSGNDTLNGGAGDDTLDADSGNDTLHGGDGNDLIDGGIGNDVLHGDAGMDLLRGGVGNDTLHFSADGLWAANFYAYNIGSPGILGPGDLISINAKNLSVDMYDGGDGFDTIVLGAGNDAIFLDDPYHGNHAQAGTLRIANIEQIDAGAGDDVVDFTHDILDYGAIVINGGDGHDYLWSSVGDDTLNGDAGDDNLYGGTGHDTLYGGDGNDVLRGGPGTSSATVQTTVQEHQFTNNVVFPNVTEMVSIMNLVPPGTNALGIAVGDLSVDYSTMLDITFIKTEAGYNNSLGYYSIGADGTIEMVDLAFPNVKNHGAGDTVSIAIEGDPTADFGFFIIADGASLNGNYSNLDLENGTLSFVYKNGSLTERLAKITDNAADIKLVYNNGTQEVVLQGANTTYHTTFRGGSTNLNADGKVHVVSGVIEGNDGDSLRLGFEDLPGTGDADYNDIVFDISVRDYVTQTLLVNDNDILHGGAGNDTLDGGVGNDRLYGGTGLDTLMGGQGADVFVFENMEAVDVIADFKVSDGDALDISSILEGYDEVSDVISSFVRMTGSGNDTLLQVNADGAGNDFVTVARITGGIGGASADDLVASGALLVA